MQVFEREAAVTEYEFVCTGDGEACDICRGLSGERFKIAERVPGLNFPPMHPWCRCFFDPVIPEKKMLTSVVDGGIIRDESMIRTKIIPSMKTDVVVERQKIHRKGTEMYKNRKAALEKKGKHGPSYTTISDDEIITLVNKFKGTGIIRTKNGKWNNQEVIVTNETVVGVAVNDITGKEAKTTVFKIHYSKNGVHIVPDYPSKKKVK